jgi:hypothetical protein
MAKKCKRGRLGHITEREIGKTETALLESYDGCPIHFHARGREITKACWKGVEEMEHRLHAAGLVGKYKGLKRQEEADVPEKPKMGHITGIERKLVSDAASGSLLACREVKGVGRLGCDCGVQLVKSNLGPEFGFSDRIPKHCVAEALSGTKRGKR